MLTLLRYILFPFSLLYALIVVLRNWCYDFGLFESKRFETPTIVVGNLSVGGTGKTPMIEFLVAALMQDRKLAILSRGYRRKSKGFVLANADSDVLDLGDEPYQMSRKYPEVPLAVDGDRRRGIARLEGEVGPEVILLDDAFQHRRVAACLSLLLTTYARPFHRDWYVPTGYLRDAKSQAKRASAIVVTKCPKTMGIKEMEELGNRLRRHSGQEVLFATLGYAAAVKNKEGAMDLELLRHRTIDLVTGIADPRPLVEHLQALDIQVVHHAYPDHHYFTAKEIAFFNSMDFVLTTEKDYVRLQGKVDRLSYLPVYHDFLQRGDKKLMELINAGIKRCSPSSS